LGTTDARRSSKPRYAAVDAPDDAIHLDDGSVEETAISRGSFQLMVFAAAMVALAATRTLAWACRPPPVGGRRWRWT
jgi:hypothetical protein